MRKIARVVGYAGLWVFVTVVGRFVVWGVGLVNWKLDQNKL